MVTNWQDYQNNTVELQLKGKSTDVKPTGTYNGKKIANGSSFFEIDTQNLKFYDADTDSWI